ncbi:hypothetical protein [Sorangium sp. So ce124]|uniref:hypothetical protein n=1 Tax=Sorangium sp. So ce124 TaxID=3133280 RepID=UPI003F5FEF87
MQQRVVAGAAVLLALASAACGTADRCDGGVWCGGAAPTEADCLEALAAHKAVDGCGVFVDPESSFDPSDDLAGTIARPVSSLVYGIELARAGRRRVFACNQSSHQEILTVPSGVDIHGRFNCERGWQYEADGYLTRIGYPDEQHPHVIVPGERDGLDDGISTFTDLDFRHSGIKYFSQSAIGILVEPNAALELVRSELVVGPGASGLSGDELRTEPLERARAGAVGNPGGDACSTDTVPGGASVTTACEDGSVSRAGKGGDGRADHGEAGRDGAPLPAPNPRGAGLGGAGAEEGGRCNRGERGQKGEVGVDGQNGRGPGRFTREGWVGENGADGKRGGVGTGGGGGGGAYGGSAACGVSPNGGASGGSGGAGGCGGQGGRGGAHGGASIGILALDGARVMLRQVAIETLGGGDGGDGERGQDGGPGGLPGGIGQYPGAEHQPCYGGAGGDGGRGGNGGSGTGGPSIGIAYVDEDQLTLEGVTFTIGAPGEGGRTFTEDGVKADDGFAAETYRFTL